MLELRPSRFHCSGRPMENATNRRSSGVVSDPVPGYTRSMAGERLDEGLRRFGVVVSWGCGILLGGTALFGMIESVSRPNVYPATSIMVVLIPVGAVGGYMVSTLGFNLLRWIIRGFFGRPD